MAVYSNGIIGKHVYKCLSLKIVSKNFNVPFWRIVIILFILFDLQL